MKIGIYGGTFDPIHNGHLYIAKSAKEELALDEVWCIPSGDPPHKDDGAVTGRMMRYDMCQLAVKDEDGIIIKDYEMASHKNCYTYELVEKLSREEPAHDYYFIMGEDSLRSFFCWVHPERIAKAVSLVVAVRSDDSLNERDILQAKEEVENCFGTKVCLLDTVNMPVSSSEIRQKISRGIDVSDDLPEEVAGYIKEHRMYKRDMSATLIEPIKKELKKELKPKRFEHTIGVMETAAALAMRYGYPVNTARIAGLLHDCAKGFSNDELIRICRDHDIGITASEQAAPHLLHAKVGAYLAEHEYGITDGDILHAIKVHTTGAPCMNLLDKIIFTADYIEPGRDKAIRLSEIRQLAFFDIELAILLILSDTMDHIRQSNMPMDEMTEETYRFYEGIR